MPGTNAGTGQPITFRCANERREWPKRGRHSVVRTGRVKKRPYRALGQRMLMEAHEYRCLTCGHVGWSGHVDVLRQPLEES